MSSPVFLGRHFNPPFARVLSTCVATLFPRQHQSLYFSPPPPHAVRFHCKAQSSAAALRYKLSGALQASSKVPPFYFLPDHSLEVEFKGRKKLLMSYANCCKGQKSFISFMRWVKLQNHSRRLNHILVCVHEDCWANSLWDYTSNPPEQQQAEL